MARAGSCQHSPRASRGRERHFPDPAISDSRSRHTGQVRDDCDEADSATDDAHHEWAHGTSRSRASSVETGACVVPRRQISTSGRASRWIIRLRSRRPRSLSARLPAHGVSSTVGGPGSGSGSVVTSSTMRSPADGGANRDQRALQRADEQRARRCRRIWPRRSASTSRQFSTPGRGRQRASSDAPGRRPSTAVGHWDGTSGVRSKSAWLLRVELSRRLVEPSRTPMRYFGLATSMPRSRAASSMRWS